MRLLVTGAGGQLGAYLLRALRGQALTVTAWGHGRGGELFGFPLEPVDMADPDRVREAFHRARPDAVVHAAALSTVSACHAHPDLARSVNAGGTALLADLATRYRAKLVLTSTDMVFDGEKGHYTEADAPAPLSVYGRTKADAERHALAVPGGLVVRLSLLFGPTLLPGRPAFFDRQVTSLRAGEPVRCFTDEARTPLSLDAAAAALLPLAASDAEGVLHVGGPDKLTRYEMGQLLARRLGADEALVVPTLRHEVPAPEPRPRDASLDCSRWRGLCPASPCPAFGEALAALPLPGPGA